MKKSAISLLSANSPKLQSVALKNIQPQLKNWTFLQEKSHQLIKNLLVTESEYFSLIVDNSGKEKTKYKFTQR